jgi:hypothetical protein
MLNFKKSYLQINAGDPQIFLMILSQGGANNAGKILYLLLGIFSVRGVILSNIYHKSELKSLLVLLGCHV